VTESIFGTTQPINSVSSQIPMIQIEVVLELTPSFIIAPSYPIIQMSNNQYLTMNPIENNILPSYLGNYGPPFVGNNNIPNPWTTIPNPYYPRNPPFTFSNTHGPMAYPFLNMVSTKIVTIRGSQGVQVFVMTPSIIVPIGELSPINHVPHFQPPARNPPLGFGNFGSGIPLRDDANAFHGSGRPLGRGDKHLGGGGGPLGKGGPPSGGGPLNGKGPSGRNGGKFHVGSVDVPFDAP